MRTVRTVAGGTRSVGLALVAVAVVGFGAGRVDGEVLLRETFADGDLTQNPAWTETSHGLYHIVDVGSPQGNVAETKGTGSLDVVIPKQTEQLTVTVKYRYACCGTDFSQVWVGIGTSEPGKDYSLRVADAKDGFGKGNNAALFREGVSVPLATGDTGVPFDTEWHTIQLRWTAEDHHLQAFYDGGTKPLFSVTEGTYNAFTHVYMGGVTHSGVKPIQFDDILIEGGTSQGKARP